MSFELLLYLAEVVANLNVIITAIFFISIVSIAFGLFLTLVGEVEPEQWKPLLNYKKYIVGFYIACLLVPNQKYLYIIAAKQVGSDAVKTELGQKVIAVLNAKLDDQIEKLTKDKK